MNDELSVILSENPCYKDAYFSFLEVHKNTYKSTPEEFAEFEKNYARDFLNGIKTDSGHARPMYPVPHQRGRL